MATLNKALTYKGAAMTWECDSNRHMNVMYYINKFENAGRNFDLEMGLSDIMSNDPNIGIVVLEQQIHYLKEVFEDDLLYIESSLLDIGNKAFTIFHEMYNARTKDKNSTMKTVAVLFDKVTRKALPFPEALKKELQSKIIPHDDLNFLPSKKLITVAKELNKSIPTITDFLRAKGFKVTNNPTVKLSGEMYQVLLNEFGEK